MKINTLLNPKDDRSVCPSPDCFCRRCTRDHNKGPKEHAQGRVETAKGEEPTMAEEELVLNHPHCRPCSHPHQYYTENENEEVDMTSCTLCETVEADEGEPESLVEDPTGRVQYPPYRVTHYKYNEAFRKFKLNPNSASDIATNARVIPYTSDKRGFGAKTGRDYLTVVQYEFSYPEGRTWTIMWDVEIGLVRITPFFKSLNYAKTAPRKAITKNDGLEAICHSITGGALAAQGYWMPFEAAMHLAATFCWKIRHALFPIFGEDFLDLCVPPDGPVYESFSIAKEIVRQCTDETRKWSLEAKELPKLAEPPRLSSGRLVTSSSEPKHLASRRKQITSKNRMDASDDNYDDDEDADASVNNDTELSDCFNDWTLDATPSPQLGFTAINRQSVPRTPARRTTQAPERSLAVTPACLTRSKSLTASSSFSYMSVDESEGTAGVEHESDVDDKLITVPRTKMTNKRNSPSGEHAEEMHGTRSRGTAMTRQQSTPGKYRAADYNVAQTLVFMAAGGHDRSSGSTTETWQNGEDPAGSLTDDQESISSVEEKGPKRGRGVKHAKGKKKTKRS